MASCQRAALLPPARSSCVGTVRRVVRAELDVTRTRSKPHGVNYKLSWERQPRVHAASDALNPRACVWEEETLRGRDALLFVATHIHYHPHSKERDAAVDSFECRKDFGQSACAGTTYWEGTFSSSIASLFVERRARPPAPRRRSAYTHHFWDIALPV